MSKPEFRLYIDESGDHTASVDTDPGKRYLGVVGVMFRMADNYPAFSSALDQLKRRHLAYDEDVRPVLHRKDIVNASGAFYRLQDKGLRQAFDSDLLRVIREARFYTIAVVVDKVSHGEKKYRRLGHPYHYALTALLERACGRCGRFGGTFDIFAESRGGREDRELQRACSDFYEKGSYFVSREIVRKTLTTASIRFKPKAAGVAGLELADLLAHPLTRDVLIEGGRLSDARLGTFTEELIKVAQDKYNRQLYDGRVRGYGRVLLG